MLAGVLHAGSGAGDQLMRLVTVRTVAEEKGFEWGMIGWEHFKCRDFMDVERGKPVPPRHAFYTLFNETDIRDSQGNDIRSFDPEINFVEDNTIIDGSFESFQYWGHNLENINKWLRVEPLGVPDTTCLIGFRGGEYAAVPELFLTFDYWHDTVLKMREYGLQDFQVHSDDPPMAQKMLGGLLHPQTEFVKNNPISHSLHSNMGYNWRSARFAKHAIIPNSAFFILPRLLKHHEDPTAVTWAPRFWAGRNVTQWRRPACWYKSFSYL